MDEFWVCQHCKSLNRFGSGKCYGCKNRYGSKPPEVETLKRDAGAPTPLPPAPPANPGAVPAAAQYLARPAALSPALGPVLGPALRPAKVNSSRESHRPHPIGAVRRRVAAWFALRQSVPVAWLGYLTAVLLTLVVIGGVILVMNLTPVISNLLQYLSVSDAWARLTASQQGTVQTLGAGVAVLAIAGLLCFSVFLGLSTHNATGLGADQPLLTPYWAGRCWTSAVWAQARIGVGLVVPAMIIWKGYTIPGLVAMIVAVEIAQRHIDDPLGWLTRPARHLPDLYAKLGIEGSIASPLAALWSISFRTVNLLVIAVAALPAIGLAIYTASKVSGRNEIVGWQSGGFGPGQLAVAILVGSLAGVAFASLAMLVPITLGLVQRQKTRKTLVRVGRSRSWVARPGEGYALAAARGDPFGEDPEDRIVERVPGYGEQGDPAFLDPTVGATGLGGQAASGPFGGQAASGPFGGQAAGGPFGGQAAGGPFGGPMQNPGFGGTVARGPFDRPVPGDAAFRGPIPAPAHDSPQNSPPDVGSDSELIG